LCFRSFDHLTQIENVLARAPFLAGWKTLL
jgi:hypothetical protein